jgi:hypothetical protein
LVLGRVRFGLATLEKSTKKGKTSFRVDTATPTERDVVDDLSSNLQTRCWKLSGYKPLVQLHGKMLEMLIGDYGKPRGSVLKLCLAQQQAPRSTLLIRDDGSLHSVFTNPRKHPVVDPIKFKQLRIRLLEHRTRRSKQSVDADREGVASIRYRYSRDCWGSGKIKHS